jgi:hypothetical protein
MAVTENTSGSTTTDGTEQTLATITSAGNYQFRIDTDNLANSDAVEVRIKVEARSSESTAKVLYKQTFAHDRGEAVIFDFPWVAIPASGQYVVTLKRVAGTDRAYPWSILTQ